MKPPALAIALLALLSQVARAADLPPSGVDRTALQASLRGTVVQTAYDEYVSEVLAMFDKQAEALRTASKDVAALSPEGLRTQLATIDTLVLTRERIGQSRRAILACTLLTRSEAEQLLGALATLRSQCDRLIADVGAPRKALLVSALEKEAAAQAMEPAAPTRSAFEVVTEAKKRLRPTGIAFLDSQYQLLLDGNRVRVGGTITVRLDREYTVTVSAITKNSYTLSFDDEELVVTLD